ncbi:MAG: hypothetical protein Alpg2KO_09850 [Alphaproteobacteria bacterium]
MQATTVGPIFIAPPIEGTEWRLQGLHLLDLTNQYFNTALISANAVAALPDATLKITGDDVIDLVLLDPETQWIKSTQGDQTHWVGQDSKGRDVKVITSGKLDVKHEYEVEEFPAWTGTNKGMAEFDLQEDVTQGTAILRVTGPGHVLPPLSRDITSLTIEADQGDYNGIYIQLNSYGLQNIETITVKADPGDLFSFQGFESARSVEEGILKEDSTIQGRRRGGKEFTINLPKGVDFSASGFYFGNHRRVRSAFSFTSPAGGNGHSEIVRWQNAQPKGMFARRETGVNLQNNQPDLFLLRNNGSLGPHSVDSITGDAGQDIVLLHPHSSFTGLKYVRDTSGRTWAQYEISMWSRSGMTVSKHSRNFKIDTGLIVMRASEPDFLTTPDMRSSYPAYPGLTRGPHTFPQIFYTRGGDAWIDRQSLPDLSRVDLINHLPNTFLIDNSEFERQPGKPATPDLTLIGDADLDKVQLQNAEKWRARLGPNGLEHYEYQREDGTVGRLITDLAVRPRPIAIPWEKPASSGDMLQVIAPEGLALTTGLDLPDGTTLVLGHTKRDRTGRAKRIIAHLNEADFSVIGAMELSSATLLDDSKSKVDDISRLTLMLGQDGQPIMRTVNALGKRSALIDYDIPLPLDVASLTGRAWVSESDVLVADHVAQHGTAITDPSVIIAEGFDPNNPSLGLRMGIITGDPQDEETMLLPLTRGPLSISQHHHPDGKTGMLFFRQHLQDGPRGIKFDYAIIDRQKATIAARTLPQSLAGEDLVVMSEDRTIIATKRTDRLPGWSDNPPRPGDKPRLDTRGLTLLTVGPDANLTNSKVISVPNHTLSRVDMQLAPNGNLRLFFTSSAHNNKLMRAELDAELNVLSTHVWNGHHSFKGQMYREAFLELPATGPAIFQLGRRHGTGVSMIRMEAMLSDKYWSETDPISVAPTDVTVTETSYIIDPPEKLTSIPAELQLKPMNMLTVLKPLEATQKSIPASKK